MSGVEVLLVVAGVVAGLIIQPIVKAFKNVKSCKSCCFTCERDLNVTGSETGDSGTNNVEQVTGLMAMLKNLKPRRNRPVQQAVQPTHDIEMARSNSVSLS